MEDSEMPDVVPVELCGKWIAWDENALHIIAAGDSMQEAIDKASILGVTEPYLEKAPPARMGFIGRL